MSFSTSKRQLISHQSEPVLPRPIRPNIDIVVNRNATAQLRNRLFDSGFNAEPMPSVNRPKFDNVPMTTKLSRSVSRPTTGLQKTTSRTQLGLQRSVSRPQTGLQKSASRPQTGMNRSASRPQTGLKHSASAAPRPQTGVPKSSARPTTAQTGLPPASSQSQKRLMTAASFEKALAGTSSTKVSITGFKNAGALRPSSANRRMGDDLRNRMSTSKTLPQLHTPAYFHDQSTSSIPPQSSESMRTLGFMNKLTGRPISAIERPQTAVTAGYNSPNFPQHNLVGAVPPPELGDIDEFIYEDLGQKQEFNEPQPSFFLEEDSTQFSDLDKFIHLAQEEETDENEFVYLNKYPTNNPYDLYVAAPESLNKEQYYTISAKGITQFHHGSPTEFISLEDWLMEREAYRQLKEIKFFKNFRDWKTCIMWKRNVNRKRRDKRTKQLAEKLYMTHGDYQGILVEHRRICLELEKQKFVDVISHTEAIPLSEFLELQVKRRAEVSDKIHLYAFKLRENINNQIQLIMDKLREEIVSRIAIDEEQKRQSGNMQMYPFKRKVTSALYEKMGFPESMNYGHRSLLRSACSKFLRFIFLAEFYTLDALCNIYLHSANDLVNKIRDLSGDIPALPPSKPSEFNFDEPWAAAQRKQEPLIVVDVELEDNPIPQNFYEESELTEFFMGRTNPLEFDPNVHLNIDTTQDVSGEVSATKMDDLEMSTLDAVDTEEKRHTLIPRIHEVWLFQSPSMSEIHRALKKILIDGLDEVMVVERWSRHPEFLDYATALEEWDDMVAPDWETPDNLYLDPRVWLHKHPDYSDLESNRGVNETLLNLLEKEFSKVDDFIEGMQKYLYGYWKILNIDWSLLKSQRLKYPVEAFINTIEMLKASNNFFEEIPVQADKGLIRLTSTNMKKEVKEQPDISIKHLSSMLRKMLKQRTDVCKLWLNASYTSLTQRVSTVEEFVYQRNSLRDVLSVKAIYSTRMDNFAQLYRVCDTYQIPVDKEDRDSFIEGIQTASHLTGHIITVESNMEKNLIRFKRELYQQIPEFIEDVKHQEMKILDEKYLTLDSDVAQCVTELTETNTVITEMEEQAEKFQKYQECLEMNTTQFEEVEYVREQLDLRLNLWRGLKEWREMRDSWITTPFKDIDVSLISKRAEEFSKIVSRSENNLTQNNVTSELKQLVFSFRETMPVVTAMSSPLEPQHWAEIKRIIGQEFEINETFTLGDLMALNVTEFQEDIQAVAVQAAQEADLKRQIIEVEEVWEELEIPVTSYKELKDVYILGDIEDLLSVLDDSCATINNILGNRYVAPLREQVTKWKDLLYTMQDIFEEWVMCQRNWMYLENIVKSSHDIKKNLASEVANFEQVDKWYRAHMKKTQQRNQALTVCANGSKLLEDLKKNNKTLEGVQKSLDSYLETKRGAFPRFYFLSDDELLEILAQSSKPEMVQPHLKKCFDNIYYLDFGPVNIGEIYGMESAEREKVEFYGNPPRPRGQVEEWLRQVQEAMVFTLQKSMKIGKEDFETCERKEFVLRKHPSQVITVVS